MDPRAPAGGADAGPDDDTPDANVGSNGADADLADAPPTPIGPPDAEPPPPPPPNSITLTFGERTGADVPNVTFDTDLRESNPTATDGNNNFVGIDANPQETGLLQIDINAVDPTLHCVSAELSLQVTDPIEDGDYELYAVTESWAEGQASWNNRKSNTPWRSAGAGPASRAPTPMATAAPRAIGEAIIPLDCATIDGWIHDPTSNHGIVFVSTSPTGRGGNFASSENSDSTTRPLLTLVVSP